MNYIIADKLHEILDDIIELPKGLREYSIRIARNEVVTINAEFIATWKGDKPKNDERSYDETVADINRGLEEARSILSKINPTKTR